MATYQGTEVEYRSYLIRCPMGERLRALKERGGFTRTAKSTGLYDFVVVERVVTLANGSEGIRVLHISQERG